MAFTEEEMMADLAAADAAGNTKAAQHIAGLIKAQRAAKKAAPAPAPGKERVAPPSELPTHAIDPMNPPMEAAPVAAPAGDSYDPTEGMSFIEKALVGGVSRAKGLGLGAAQTLLPKALEEKLGLQAAIDEQKRLDKPVNETGGGMVGNALVDIASFALPGGAATKALKLGTLIPRLTSPAAVKIAQAAAASPKLASLASGAGVSAAQSAAFDPLASDESLGEKSLFAGAGGAAGKVGGELVNRIISPFRGSTSTARQQAAKLLKDQGIELSAGQEIGSPFLRQIEMGLKQNPLTKALMTADSPEQKAAVSRMFAKEIGAGGDAPLTADVMGKAQRELGGTFKALEGKTAKIGYDNDYAKDYLALTQRLATKQVDMGVESPQVTKLLENAMERATNGRPMSGSAYNELRSNLSDLAFNEKSGIVKDAAKALMKMEDSQAIRAFGKEARDVAEARANWGKTKRLTTPGVLDLEGNVNTTTLGNAVRQRDRDAFARGTLDSFGQKAKAAQEILKPMGPDSGTASNTLMAKALANPLTLLGGGAGATYGAINDPAAGTKGALSMGAFAALTQTKTGRKYLANALMKDNPELAKFIQRSGRTIGAQFAAD